MRKTANDLVSRYLRGRTSGDIETRIIQSALDRQALSRDLNADYAHTTGVGDRLADGIARVGGSWGFIVGFLVFLVLWAIANVVLLQSESFDPYPFVFLNLILSMLAAIQAPIIMMSQNRQAARDRLDAAHDYEVNLKAEIEIMALHEKLDELRQSEIVGLREDVARLTEMLGHVEARLQER